MRRHDLEALEYPRVLARLAELAQSPAGAEMCRLLRPHGDAAEVEVALEQSWQCHRMLETEERLPSVAVADITTHLTSACRDGSVLEGAQLVDVLHVLGAGRALASFLRRRAEAYPAMAPIGERLRPPQELADVLSRSLDADGVVKDDASDELAGLRATLRHLRDQLTRRLEALVARHTLADVVAEQYVTIRNNRFVVPMRAHYGQKLQGIVQDRSASGETVFLEPLFAVELNNALLMAAREEERVVRRILGDLTALVRAHAAEVADTFAALTVFDVLGAKARFARTYGCIQPRLTAGAIDLRQARHPVLLFGDRPVVPVDIRLPADKRALVVTGPNTGGKTVALKTAGLLSLMAQSGILIPAAEGSGLPCWRGVYADVGDEQNIQRNLSTFSAHVSNLADIERQLEPPALVLLDEPGVGTDPEEGAALAVGLLCAFGGRDVRILATTHYAPVKLHALTADDCVVAAVDFERDTLAPRYRLVYGSLGESLALPVAARIGLSAGVLQAARTARSAEGKTIESALLALEDARRGYEERLAAAERSQRDLSGRERELSSREEEVARLLQDLQQRRRDRWRDELTGAREFAREVKEEGKRLLARLQAGEASRQEIERFAHEVAVSIDSRRAEIEEPHAGPAPALQAGDTVELTNGGFRGELVSVSGGRAWIRHGTMRVEVPAEQLRLVSGAPRPSREPGVHVAAETPEAPSEVTLVGLRAKEALAKLEDFLDRATLAGHPSVRVVHGVGSGALRRAVHQYLDVSPYCGSYRSGGAEEGGAGVTVVEIGR